MPLTSSGSPTLSNRVMRGLSEPNGSWKIIWISGRSGRSSAGTAGRGRRRGPSRVRKRISPPIGAMARRMQRDGRGLAAAALADQAQRLALVDGEAHVVDRAHVADDALRGSPSRMGKNFRRLRTSSSGAAGGRARLDVTTWPPRRGRGSSSPAAGRRPAGGPGRAGRSTPGMTSGQRGWNGQPRGPVEGVRQGAGDDRQGDARRGLEARDRAQQGPRVGMLGRVEDVVDRPLLHDPAEIHHHDLARHLGDHAEVVGDEDDRRSGTCAAARAAGPAPAPGS